MDLSRATKYIFEIFHFTHRKLLKPIGFLRSYKKNDKPKNILVHVKNYLPKSRGGAEVSLGLVVKYFSNRGYAIKVLVNKNFHTINEFDYCILNEDEEDIKNLYSWADIVFTQLHYGEKSLKYSLLNGCKSVYFFRSSKSYPKKYQADILVFNSNWWRQEYGNPKNSLVVYPSFKSSDYKVKKGDYVSIIGLTELKGIHTFYKIAERLPSVTFLGVKSSWGEQIMPPEKLNNVIILNNQDDIRQVYSKTKILLIPSEREAFGRVAVEAGFSSIPSIAHPNKGAKEAMGESIQYAKRADINEWVRLIKKLNSDKKIYNMWSKKAYRKSSEYDNYDDLCKLEEFLIKS